ncbi:jerky protein homolog-like [Ischnura elegans]|uniref:jerky protein homolog-like n=1 Tax=Ischnura elegans TaxID=197161 RepID=UPI001ED89A47|nr:jerky protein homolog-like [Ischnura elegans]
MSLKRKRVVLSLADKVKIIEQLDRGASAKKLSEMYSVATSTISDIKNSRSSILSYVSTLDSEDGRSSRKAMRAAENKELDDEVFKWFLQQRAFGNPLSNSIICEMARRFAEQIEGLDSFKASHGWLRNFKARHGIRELELGSEKPPDRPQEDKKFLEKFKIEAKSYDPEFLYNADETGLIWKALPGTISTADRESSHKVAEDRVTFLICANSTGEHKIPLLLIGKTKSPDAFKGIKTLPLFYMSQPKAWMTAALFTEWYDSIFVPEVKKYQKTIGKEGSKVLLIIDSAPIHPTENILERENGLFKVLHVPTNVASQLQPMDQLVIEKTKLHYRKQLLQKLLFGDEKEILNQYNGINLKDCSYMIAEAWNSVNRKVLQRAWYKLKGTSTKKEQQKEREERKREEDEEKNTLEAISIMILKIPGCYECSEEDVGKWLACDSSDYGFQMLGEDEPGQSDPEETSDDPEDGSIDTEPTAGPSASEVFSCLRTALRWMEQQPECDHLQLLTIKRIQDLAMYKQVKTAKHLLLTNMLKQ